MNDMIKKAKVNFEMELVKKIKEDPKSFYAYAWSKSRAKVCIGPLLDKLGKLSNDQIILSEILNDYFSSVFTKEDLATMPDMSIRKKQSSKSFPVLRKFSEDWKTAIYKYNR